MPHQSRLLLLFLSICLLFKKSCAKSLPQIEGVEIETGIKCNKMLLAKQIIAINKTEHEIGAKLLNVCNLLECAKDVTTIDGCLKKAFVKHSLHPDKIKNAEDSKLAEKAFKIIDSLRTYIKNNYQDVNDIFRAHNISKPIVVKIKGKDSAKNGGTEINLNIDSIKNINRAREYLKSENIFEIFDGIETFLEGKKKSLREKFYKMRDEIKFLRIIFFNEEFEKCLKEIEGYGMENYDMRLEKIDKLIIMISKKISWISWSGFTILKQKELEKIAELKIMDIMKWKENVYKAMSKKVERDELRMQAQNIEQQKLELNNYNKMFINFENLPNLFIPPKFTKLNKKLEKKHAEIDSTYNKEYTLINSPNNRPSYVYNNKWQHWQHLFYTKHFFMAIDDMETFNLLDEQTIKLNKFYYGTAQTSNV